MLHLLSITGTSLLFLSLSQPGYNGPLGGTQQIYQNFPDFVASDLYLFNIKNQ